MGGVVGGGGGGGGGGFQVKKREGVCHRFFPEKKINW